MSVRRRRGVRLRKGTHTNVTRTPPSRLHQASRRRAPRAGTAYCHPLPSTQFRKARVLPRQTALPSQFPDTLLLCFLPLVGLPIAPSVTTTLARLSPGKGARGLRPKNKSNSLHCGPQCASAAQVPLMPPMLAAVRTGKASTSLEP